MASVVLNAYRVEEMQFRNVLDSGAQIKLENKYSFNVKYDKDNKCIGLFSVEVYDKNNKDEFFAKTKITAFYSLSWSASPFKSVIHNIISSRTDTFNS